MYEVFAFLAYSKECQFSDTREKKQKRRKVVVKKRSVPRTPEINQIVYRAACKTLIDSERRKNTQTSNDVGARQLARF